MLSNTLLVGDGSVKKPKKFNVFVKSLNKTIPSLFGIHKQLKNKCYENYQI